MKFYFLLSVLLLGVTTNSFCAKKKKQKTQKSTQTKVLNSTSPLIHKSSLELCYTDYGMPSWNLEIGKGFQFPFNFQAPLNYKLVSINDKLLNEYLNTIPFEKSTKKILIPIFNNNTIDCKEFIIERVMTMDSALQAKYPALMSFRVYEKTNSLNAGRIDCDGNNTRIMVTINNETFFDEPILFNNKYYYACYSKNDPNLKKKTFEQNIK